MAIRLSLAMRSRPTDSIEVGSRGRRIRCESIKVIKAEGDEARGLYPRSVLQALHRRIVRGVGGDKSARVIERQEQRHQATIPLASETHVAAHAHRPRPRVSRS